MEILTQAQSTDIDQTIAALDIAPSQRDFHPRAGHRLQSSMAAEIVVAPDRTVSATVRDVSATGMGFFHQEPIPQGEVLVKAIADGEELKLRVCVEWCHPCKDGTYISGGSYVRRPAMR